MGFSAGLYVRKKLFQELPNGEKKEIKLTEAQNSFCEYVRSYETNEWAKQRFSSPMDYARTYAGYLTDDKEDFVEPSNTIIEIYKATNSLDKSPADQELCYWCSNGAGDMWDWLHSYAQNIVNSNSNKNDGICYCNADSLKFTLNQLDLVQFACYCWGEIKKALPEPCRISRSYKYVPSEDKDETGEGKNNSNESMYYEVEPDIRLTTCVGIEVQYEDGQLRRFDSDDFAYGLLMPKEMSDDWSLSGFVIGLEGALKALETVDFQTEEVYYEGGW